MRKILAVFVLLCIPLLVLATVHHSNTYDFSDSFISQSGTLATTTLLTAPEDRDYIVTLYLENVTPAPTSTVQATLSWTDDVHTRQVSVTASTATLQSNSAVYSARIRSGQSLVLDATDFGGAQNYTIYVTAKSTTLH